MSLGIVCVRPVKAQTQSDITMNPDGSVTPSTAPIQQTGDIYTLTSEINGSITIERSNIVLDGNGQILNGGTFNGEYAAITISDQSNVTVKNFQVTSLYPWSLVLGIVLESSSNVTLSNNTISGTGTVDALNGQETAGIYVEGEGSNIVTGNNLVNNIEGMDFSGTNNNLIAGNTITSKGLSINGVGIDYDASNNTIYHNNFMNSPIGGQAADSGSINVWDDGFPSGGNYWSDYKATEIGNTGIGNQSYIIDSQNKDQYPLMTPFNASFLLNYEQETVPPKFSVLSPLDKTYSNSNVSLSFSVNKLVSWVSYSLDGQQNVTITGNTTLTEMTNGEHTIVLYANDTFGDMSASQTINFTVDTPFPTALVVAISAALLVVVAGLLVYFRKRKRVTVDGHE